MHVTIPTVKAQDASCNKMMEYLEWEAKSFREPLLTSAKYLTLALCIPAFSAVDCLCQTAILLGKIVTLNISSAELREHSQKAALYGLHALASSVSLAASLVLTAAFLTQFSISVSLAIRVTTLVLLLVSGSAAYWVHNPDRLVAHFRKYELVYTKTRWDRVKDYFKEKKDAFMENKPRYVRQLKRAAKISAITAGATSVAGVAWLYYR